MSQEKVNYHKEQKKNRKKIMRKEKAGRIARQCVAYAILIAILGWAGWSGYTLYQDNKPVSYTEVNTSAITDYYTSLSED